MVRVLAPMTGNEIRQRFLDFFAERGHTVKPSYPLVPPDDPTLLFTGAGMVQFKREFLGEVPLVFTRAVTSQKCFRMTDIENVGRTARHHTFFEMLGNFSFGDYFKAESCAWGWEFLTGDMGIPADRLYATVYTDDDAAYDIWRDIGVPEDRISRHGEADNFWKMGPTGPCGPCGEIFYDYGPDAGCGRPDCAVGCDCDRYVEIWNHVFTQYDRQDDGSLVDLPQKNIDTGMGLERLAAVLQGTPSNFETDLLFPIIEAAQELTGVPYKENVMAYRVLADHARALTFVMSDGVLPSNEGRGYVVRRILRRAVKYGRDLGLTDPFLSTLSGTVVDMYGEHYTELRTQQEQVGRMIASEEESFQTTVVRATDVLEEHIRDLPKGSTITDLTIETGGVTVPVTTVLYDTYGLPLDIVKDIAVERGLKVDEEAHEKGMELLRARAREADTRYEEAAGRQIYRDLAKEVGATTFLGYDTTSAEGTVLALLQDGARVDAAAAGSEAEVILDQTPCYPEAGGQVADEAVFACAATGARAEALAVLQPAEGLTVHRVTVTAGSISVGDRLVVTVPEAVRRSTAIHHSATHILHAVLREVLGDHVTQAGSYVGPDRLRFDYTHFEAPSRGQLDTIETLVNTRVRQAAPVETAVKPIDEARAEGAMALFGEKYGEFVRVVRMGDFSTELCGGTHLRNTGEIGTFHLLSDGSIAAGTRRIEAVAGPRATELLAQETRTLAEAATLLNVPPAGVAERVRQLLDERKQLEKQLAGQERKRAASSAAGVLDQVQDVQGIPVLAVVLDNLDGRALRDASDSLRQKLPEGVLVLGSAQNGKVGLLCSVSDGLTSRIKAGDVIKQLAGMVGGGGGGKPHFAQAGGKNPDKLPEAIAAAPQVIADLLAPERA